MAKVKPSKVVAPVELTVDEWYALYQTLADFAKDLEEALASGAEDDLMPPYVKYLKKTLDRIGVNGQKAFRRGTVGLSGARRGRGTFLEITRDVGDLTSDN